LTHFNDYATIPYMNQINLTDKEKRVLSVLYRLEEGFVSKISKETLINRTSLYPILEKLLERGLISKISIEGKTAFQALPVEEFEDWVNRQKETAIQESDDLLSWAKQQKTKSANSLISDIKFYEGFDGVQNLYSDTLHNNKGKMIYAITDYENAYKVMPEFFTKKYFQERVKRGIQVKNILPDSSIGREDFKKAKELLREMKFIKLFEDLSIEINIYDSKVAIIAFDERNPSGVLIKNDIIAKAFKNIFGYIWETK